MPYEIHLHQQMNDTAKIYSVIFRKYLVNTWHVAEVNYQNFVKMLVIQVPLKVLNSYTNLNKEQK